MTSAIKWEAALTSRGDVLTTQLNSLAASARSAAGAEVDNSTNLDTYGFLVLYLTFGTAPGSNKYVTLVVVTAPDGTNYEDGSDTVAPSSLTWVADVPVRAVNTAQRLVVPFQRGGDRLLPPTKMKFLLVNNADQALNSTGNTVTLYTGNLESQ